MIQIQWKTIYTAVIGVAIGSFLTFVVNRSLLAGETAIRLDVHLSEVTPLKVTLAELKTFNDKHEVNIERIPKMDSVMQGLLYEVKAIRLILEKGK